ncbi:MAG: hypothetical protein HYX68_25715 [Planctomycetes bacterium]|nr:hypothetical protein [Planctomycetota bacterium]
MVEFLAHASSWYGRLGRSLDRQHAFLTSQLRKFHAAAGCVRRIKWQRHDLAGFRPRAGPGFFLVSGKPETFMVYNLGRMLQLLGLLVLPIAMAGEVAESISLGRMLTWASVGIGLFIAGWPLQQTAGKK